MCLQPHTQAKLASPPRLTALHMACIAALYLRWCLLTATLCMSGLCRYLPGGNPPTELTYTLGRNALAEAANPPQRHLTTTNKHFYKDKPDEARATHPEHFEGPKDRTHFHTTPLTKCVCDRASQRWRCDSSCVERGLQARHGMVEWRLPVPLLPLHMLHHIMTPVIHTVLCTPHSWFRRVHNSHAQFLHGVSACTCTATVCSHAAEPTPTVPWPELLLTSLTCNRTCRGVLQQTGHLSETHGTEASGKGLRGELTRNPREAGNPYGVSVFVDEYAQWGSKLAGKTTLGETASRKMTAYF